MRRVLPEPAGSTNPDELAAGTRRRIGPRPWVGLCMVVSLDGTTVVDGRSGGLSTANDAALLGALRRAADVVLVGAGTVRGEGYGRPKRRGLRIGVVTATGAVDVTSDLFESGSGFLVMPEDGPPAPPGRRRAVDIVRAGTGRVDVALALARLDQVMAPPVFAQVEGGPRLNATLLDAGCVDELNLTISPVLAGGRGPRLTAGADAALVGYDLVHLATDDESFLYGRWHRRRL
ncbi:MAG: dihydrofolate reductase family protein [Actinomycetota bacterium]|nr:dihydrofolate reductase family protein [Acidimicrobiia bacterium]MDQ3469885.1 dihydrofolate reductase family protein [Actinomycetota bacterium]